MKKMIVLFAACFLLATTALARDLPPLPPEPPLPAGAPSPALAPQQPAPAPAPPAPNADPFGGALFPPELIMRHQRAIDLTADQRDDIRGIIRTIQPQFQDIQWEMQDLSESMRELLEKSAIDEESVLAQLEKILDAERRVKRLQVTLMIRIKNTLTARQQQQLRAFRAMGETGITVRP